MEIDNGVLTEDEKEVVIVEKSNDGQGSTQLSGENDKEGVDTSAPPVDAPATVSKNKDSNGNGSKNPKLGKNQTNSKGTVVAFGRSTRASLTHSLSFPDKGRRSDVIRRSIEVHPHKLDVKQTQAARVESRVANGNISPRVTNAGKAISGRATLPSSSSLRQSSSFKKPSANGTTANPAKDMSNSRLVEKDTERGNIALRVKEDEDSLSTTSSTQRRINASALASRLEERAAKRKEFNSKIEEKTHAEEVKKSNLEAKSKEYQEAEIKQLRKNLTFKATPMPTFYKEPPAKVVLKKIPTTRPVSPKFGRHKTSASIDSLENSGSSLSPRFTKDSCKSPKYPHARGFNVCTPSKKPIKSSLSKLQTRESSTPRNDKHTQTEGGKETKNRPHCTPELEDQMEQYLEKHSGDGNESNVATTMPSVVTVEG